MAAGDVTTEVVSLDVRSSAKFDGVDDVITASTALTGVYSAVTMAAWIKCSDFTADQRTVFGARTQLRLYIETNGRVTANTNSGLSDTFYGGLQEITANKWHHIAFVWDGTNMYSFLDGVKGGEEASTGTMTLTSATEIGRRATDNNDHFYGNMRDLRFYNKALTQAEITTLANNGNVTRALKNHWKLNGDATDSVGGFDGTVSGALFVDDESNTAEFFRDVRVSGNDKFVMARTNNNMVVGHVEEA